MMKERLTVFVARLPEREVDAVLVSAPENRRYLSGFTGSAGNLLVSGERAVLVTDSRYSEQATNQATEFQVHQVPWRLGLVDGATQGVGHQAARLREPEYDRLLLQQPAGRLERGD